jgi:cob(I)alamin adenosyltransferase
MRYFFIVLVLMVLSFGGGFWWEHGRAASAQSQLNVANAQLAKANDDVRLCRLQDDLLTLVEDTANKNYGDAATASTQFFNQLSAELAQTNQPALKSAMQSILGQRDQVTAAIAKADPASHDTFVQMSASVHQALQPVLSSP